MKRTPKITFFIVFALIAALVYTAFFGVYTTYGDLRKPVIKSASDIRFGIDIKGGVDATFGPAEGVENVTDAQIEGVKDVIELRLVNNGITDYEVYADTANDTVIVRYPWKNGEENYDAQASLDDIGKTAQLAFYYDDPTLEELSEENRILTGADVESADVGIDPENNSSYIVSLKLKDSGKKAFKEATEKQVQAGNAPIAIWLDDQRISAPNVQSVIADGSAQISGGFDLEEANELANYINAGALDFAIEVKNYGSVSPTLGESALDAMVLAGIIAFILIAIFIIVIYRLPGFIAVIALTGQVAGSIAAVSGFFGFANGFTLTLPGIAGIILSVGMGIDANVITAERIRDEVRLGKTIDGAITIGSKSAFSAIFDGNVTTMFVAVILMGVFGPPSGIFSKLLYPFLFMFPQATTGTIYSFGYTLLMGILFNFIMGVFASRLMLKSITRFKAFRKPWLIGGARK